MRRRRYLRGLVIVGLCALGVAACTNDPFDPAGVPNRRPTVRFFVGPVTPDGELSPTSYFNRTFHWSGSDADGRVEEYYVSIRTAADVPAAWDTTTATDTTLTFTTDDEGRAEATFLLACRDDQGAVSDTLVQYVPLRNFPPALNFQSDFEPLVNLQREIISEGGTPVDTVYWNWGVMNVRCFAFDLDGNATMDDFYRYTLADTEPTETYPWDDPAADPSQHWLAVPFDGVADILEFELLLTDVPPGARTLTIAVRDEADAETRLRYSWEVRAPRGRLLMVGDNSGPATRTFYRTFLDGYFGAGGWDEYDFWFGLPDDPDVLLETLRRFDCVLWFDGGGTSAVLEAVTGRNGPLERYILPTDGAAPGRLLMVSRNLTGAASLIGTYFRQNVFGIHPTAEPPSELRPTALGAGMDVLGLEPYLPTMNLQSQLGRGRGLKPRYDEPTTAYDELYRFEDCYRCFQGQPAPPPGGVFMPLIAVRRPQRVVQTYAQAVGFSFELHAMAPAGAYAALAAVLEHELGVAAP